MNPNWLIISGIGWEPEIRGLLTVVLASAVLIGSVWLLLVTNTGIRLGSLVTLAGFFAWFTIMAGTWWLFGIGYSGDAPSWQFIDSYADVAGSEPSGIEDAFLADVELLPDPNCTVTRVFPRPRLAGNSQYQGRVAHPRRLLWCWLIQARTGPKWSGNLARWMRPQSVRTLKIATASASQVTPAS